MKILALAAELHKLADYLEKRSEMQPDSLTFHEDYVNKGITATLSFYAKEKFVEFVKTVGNATKVYTFPDKDYSQLKVTPENYPELNLTIARDKVCRKVTKYECESLFSNEELETL